MKNYHKNPRQIKDKQFANLRAWLSELGDLSGIVHDLNTDEVISGNQRMRAIDIAKCELVLTEGPHEPDAQGTVSHGYVLWQGAKYNYRQVRWTPEQCEKANIVANKAGGSWDFDILANEWERDDLLEWGFELEELGMLPDDDVPEDPGAQIDRAAELQAQWQTFTGQLWAIGEHRLAVGDCTDAAIVARVMGGEKAVLMWTDPPYHVGKKFGHSVDEGTVWDDEFQTAWLAASVSAVASGAQRYVCFAQAQSTPAILLYKPNRILVWCKPFALMRANEWDWAYEFIAWCYDTEKPAYFDKPSGTASFDWQEIASVIHGHEGRWHITQKPIALPESHIKASSPIGAIVFDPFLGSGTTMVAAQRLGRRCFGIEIDPGYSAVCLQRMRDMGIEPVLLEPALQ